MGTREPADPTNPVHPQRLLAAADSILHAEAIAGHGTVMMWRDDSRPARNGYSSEELLEAVRFLRRLGLLLPEHSGRAGRRE